MENVYADYREMLDKERIDVVDLNLRWDRGMSPARVEAVREVAGRGIHVQIAKPLAATYAQCVAIVEAARRGGVKLAVNQNSRYAPAFFAAGESSGGGSSARSSRQASSGTRPADSSTARISTQCTT